MVLRTIPPPMLGDPAPDLPERDHPWVEDTGKKPVPPRPLSRDVELLLDTIDELRSRLDLLNPGGQTTSSDPKGW